MENYNFAPVVLFVYARPEHTKKTILALLESDLAKKTDLIIYSDYAKTDRDKPNVDAVRCIINEIVGFNSVKVIHRKSNFGLAANIIDGVSKICSEYGKAIILEDDIVVDKSFLSFMNDALLKYKDNKNVWHIAGWNYPINSNDISEDAYFWNVMNCWGWATWEERWDKFEKNPEKLKKTWSTDKIHKFNLDGIENFWAQVEGNLQGKMNTWAVFWYATIFENEGLCLNPTVSLVKNIGIDGSGENCSFNGKDYISLEKSKEKILLPDNVLLNKKAVDKNKEFYIKIKPTFVDRVINKIKRILLK